MWVIVGVILFVLNVKNTCQYEVPQPEITVHRPRGFSVSIPHESGIEIFAFHGNINRKLVGLGAEEFSVDIRKQENGKWTFHESSRKLKGGDVIYYWLFVMKDGLGYRLLDGRFVVEESLNSHSSSDEHKTAFPSQQENPTCLECILNVTKTLLEQQAYIDALELANKQMRTYIEQQKDGRKLITFEVPSVEDKIEILQAARKKLATSAISIT